MRDTSRNISPYFVQLANELLHSRVYNDSPSIAIAGRRKISKRHLSHFREDIWHIYSEKCFFQYKKGNKRTCTRAVIDIIKISRSIIVNVTCTKIILCRPFDPIAPKSQSVAFRERDISLIYSVSSIIRFRLN